MIKKRLFGIILSILSGSVLQAQTPDFSGYKIFINPGHGGHDSDDRHILTTDFWESEGNLEKGLFLHDLMVNMNATVYLSRTTNYTSDDLALSAIAAMANSANVDFFLSIHSNGYAGTQNQPLMLFRGYDDQPVYPASKTMAQILWQKIFEKGNCWTSSAVWVKGDWTFYPEWGDKVGLGVLRTLTMPGVLSEGSFHDYIPESWRLKNNDFLHHESWAFLRAFSEYMNVTPLESGIVAGIVRDSLHAPVWYFKPGTKDEALPLNGVDVTLMPGGENYHIDDLNNGFFLFDSLPAGEYKLYFDGLDEYFRDSVVVIVTANKSTLADCNMQFDTTIVPVLTGISPSLSDSLVINQAITFTFSLPMNRDSVNKAINFEPFTEFTCDWDDKSMILVVRPVQSFTGKTHYIINLTTTACSKWEIPFGHAEQFNFITRNRQHLKIERNFPEDGTNGITLYPQIRVYFDAPVNETSVAQEILLKDDQGHTVSKKREQYITSEGKGAYYFEPSDCLELNKQYQVILGEGLTDAYGTTLGKNTVISFTTRSKAYDSGAAIEPFENISHFWDPDASGSTTGTDNPLTTFTTSSDIVYSGTYSGRLDYVFTGNSGGVCRTFDSAKPSIGSDASKYFGIWVFGDLTNNALEYWFYSSGTTNQIVSVDTIDWAGWDLKIIPLSKIGGSGDKLYHSTVIRQTDTGEKKGTIWFDNAVVFTPTTIVDMNEEGADLELYPNPLNGEGTIRFNLSEKATVSFIVYSLDGRKVQEQCYGMLEPGVKILQWNPSNSLPDGIYLLRLEFSSRSGNYQSAVFGKWILSR